MTPKFYPVRYTTTFGLLSCYYYREVQHNSKNTFKKVRNKGEPKLVLQQEAEML